MRATILSKLIRKTVNRNHALPFSTFSTMLLTTLDTDPCGPASRLSWSAIVAVMRIEITSVLLFIMSFMYALYTCHATPVKDNLKKRWP